MITAVVTDVADNVVYNISFQGCELFLGAILGGIAAVVVWLTLKNFAK
jgi:hypothetical protein